MKFVAVAAGLMSIKLVLALPLDTKASLQKRHGEETDGALYPVTWSKVETVEKRRDEETEGALYPVTWSKADSVEKRHDEETDGALYPVTWSKVKTDE